MGKPGSFIKPDCPFSNVDDPYPPPMMGPHYQHPQQPGGQYGGQAMGQPMGLFPQQGGGQYNPDNQFPRNQSFNDMKGYQSSNQTPWDHDQYNQGNQYQRGLPNMDSQYSQPQRGQSNMDMQSSQFSYNSRTRDYYPGENQGSGHQYRPRERSTSRPNSARNRTPSRNRQAPREEGYRPNNNRNNDPGYGGYH